MSIRKLCSGYFRLLAPGLLLLPLIGSVGCYTPQVMADEEVFTSLDALWTAVTSRKMDRLQEVTNRLIDLREAGKLSSSGWRAVEPILQCAFEEKWETAAKRLKQFIQAQRRE